MRWSPRIERAPAVAAWLFMTAFLVFAMVIVGGATRLTGSGLSITEWKPIMGALPPLTHNAWLQAFAKYRRIPQYRLINAGMTLGQFQFIFAWEWTHRLLGRLIGLVFFAPLVVFLVLRRIPERLVWRCWLLLGLGALQGFVGWWMVASGLSQRVSVAPERLATHLGLALLIYAFAVWTGLEALYGRGHRPMLAARWRNGAAALTAMIFIQLLLGALVAGNQAGRVYTDWPLMDGRLFPPGYVRGGLWETLAHNQAAVQFDHRLWAYLIVVAAIVFVSAAFASRRLPQQVKFTAGLLALGVAMQVGLGIVTLMLAAPLAMSLAHQVWAVVVLTIALCLAWRMQRV